ncbi:MAG: RNA-directed DNA polymerase [Gammaproteobacteria bacterium]|nr:RNA-directed DNA polymerase [Gammaproteobacteria bacterium]
MLEQKGKALSGVKLEQDALFSDLFSPDALIEAFRVSFSNSVGKGIDRRNGFQFQPLAEAELTTASKKITDGSFRFSPYLEVLKTKNRHSPPRLISIPTIRDRVVLHQLNKFLASIYPDCVPRNIAATYVRELNNALREVDPATTWVCGLDIRTFYDSIVRQRLLAGLTRRTTQPILLGMVRHAINTPTIPRNVTRTHHRDYRSHVGIPQGLAISNILASIYMRDVDRGMALPSIRYFRYVDDVLMFGPKDQVQAAAKSLSGRLKRRGLSLHPVNSGTSHFGPLPKQFGYLGYVFKWPAISVREATIERFLQSIAAKFSDFTHNKARRLERLKYLNEKRICEIFVMELNERITGAISEHKRYGWIAYFNQITDLTLLHRMDRTIADFFRRLPEFGHSPPAELQKLSRAYFEMKFNPTGGYVRNYDSISTRPQMLTFLLERGQIGPDDQLTDDDIRSRFLRYRNRVLSAMNADEADVYA